MHDGRDASRSSWIAVGIVALTRISCRWPRLTLWLVAASTLFSGWFAARNLPIKTQRSDLIDPRADYQQRWLDYARTFEDVTEDLVVVVEGSDAEKVRGALDELGPLVEREPRYFRNVLYRVDLRGLASKGLQLLPLDRLRMLQHGVEQLVQGANSDLEAAVVRLAEGWGRWPQLPPDVQPQLAAETQQLVGQLSLLTPDSTAPESWSAEARSSATLTPEFSLSQTRDGGEAASNPAIPEWPPAPEAQGSPQAHGPQPTPGAGPPAVGAPVGNAGMSAAHSLAALQDLFAQAPPEFRYLLNDAGTMGFLQAQPVVPPGELAGAAASVARMRRILRAVAQRHPDCRLGLTGVPVLEFDEMELSQREMSEASVVSFVGVTLLLLAGFRRLRHPVLGTVMLLVGTAWSFAAAALIVGHLNILSIAFTAMLFGLGNDFAIVYLSYYAEQRERGRPLKEALLDASRNVGPGITTAACTAAAAFFAAGLTDFAGVAELGLIAGAGLLLCNLLTFIFIPPALAVWDAGAAPPAVRRAVREAHPPLRRAPALALSVYLAVLGWTAWKAPDVRYDSNLLNMQAAGTDAMQVQQRIEQQQSESLLFAVSLARSPAEALERKRQFESLGTVARVEEIASLVPRVDARRAEVLASLSAAGVRLQSAAPMAPPNPASIGRVLDRLLDQLLRHGGPQLAQSAAQLDRFLEELSQAPLDVQLQWLSSLNPPPPAELLGALQSASLPPVTLQDLPVEFTSRYVGRDGRWLLKIYAEQPIWDGAPLAEFVAELRTVDPDVTGTPVQNLEASRAIWSSYLQAGGYALIAVTILLWWDFRTIHETLLALSPAAAALAATLGILGRFDIPLNPANMLMLPLLLGLGVDGGVHVLHDYRSQSGAGYRMTGSTVRSLVLTAATSIIGFGSLMLASHRGLFSLGFVLTAGVTTSLLTSLVPLPAVLSLMSAAGSGDAFRTPDRSETAPERRVAAGLAYGEAERRVA